MSAIRRQARIPVAWMAYYQRPEDEGRGWSHPVRDLSLSGGFLQTSAPLAPGASFEVVLLSSSGPLHSVRTRAEVMWRGRKEEGQGMGVRFAHDSDTEARLEAILDRMAA